METKDLFSVLFPIGKQDMKAALLHEVTHYQKHDTKWRYLAEFVHCIQWFNPLTKALLKEIGEWSEACCDYASGTAYGSLRKYFNIVSDRTLRVEEGYFGFHMSMLYTKEEYLERRVQRVRSCQKARQKGRWFPAVCAGAFFVLSTGAVWAATEGVLDLHEQAYRATVVALEETAVDVKVWEEADGWLSYSESIYMEEPDSKQKVSGSSIPLDWRAGGGELHASTSFYQRDSDCVEIMASVKPSDCTVRIGIIAPDGRVCYVTGSG